MSSARRIQRRGAKPKALATVEKALQAVGQMQGLHEGLQGLSELDGYVKETHQLVSSLVEDYQGLLDRVEALEREAQIQREVTLRIVPHAGLSTNELRALEAAARKELE